MTYIIQDFYWLGTLFTIEVKGVSDDGQNSEIFTLTFANPTVARDSFEVALAAAANARWGTNILASQVFGTKLIPTLAPTDNNGNPIISIHANTAVGLPNMTIQNVPDDCASYRRSWLIECPPQIITIRDIRIANDLVGPMGVCYVSSSFFGCATEAALGSQIQIDLIDRDDILGYFGAYGLSKSKINIVSSETIGNFEIGEEIRSSTCRAKVLAVGINSLDITFDRWNSIGQMSNFTTDEIIVGQNSGAISKIGEVPFVEGDFIFLQRFIMDEALYRYKSHEQKPGGSKIVPQGLYFRSSIWNNHATESLFIDGSIDIGKK